MYPNMRTLRNSIRLNSIPPLDKIAPISQTTFSNVFSWIKSVVCILIKVSLKFVPKGPIDHIPALVLDNGLAPNRWQAIIWTNTDSTRWHVYAALAEDELKSKNSDVQGMVQMLLIILAISLYGEMDWWIYTVSLF